MAHLSALAAEINASNPCSEYMFLDDTACNLASLNLMAVPDQGAEGASGLGGGFDVAGYEHCSAAVDRNPRDLPCIMAQFPSQAASPSCLTSTAPSASGTRTWAAS